MITRRSLILALLLVVISLTIQARVERVWVENKTLSDSTLLWQVPTDAETVTVEACVAMRGLRDCVGENDKWWSLTLINADGEKKQFKVGWGNTCLGDFSDARYLKVSGVDSEPTKLTSRVNVYSGDNTMIVEVDTNGIARVFVGSDSMNYVGDVKLSSRLSAIELTSHGEIKLSLLCIESHMAVNLESGLDENTLLQAATARPAPLGAWHYLDRDNDADYALPGGLYDLVVVPDASSDNAFLIIYMGGATVAASDWKPGMIKGRLTPTNFAGKYRLEWWGANREKIDDECHATVEGEVMTLVFPLLHSQIRYSR